MSMRTESSFNRLKKIGKRLLSGQLKTNVKAQPIPADVAAERRSGRRVPLPLEVRIKLAEDEDPRNAKIRDVNMTGLAVEPGDRVDIGDHVSIGFDGYPEVCAAFALVTTVKRILPATEPGEVVAMGVSIDRERTSAEAQKNYRRLVRHYLHHRPLLQMVHKGYFEGRCTSCDWVGRVGQRNPRCSRCGSQMVPLADDVSGG